MTLAIETTDLRRSFTVRTGWLRPERRTIEAVRRVDLAVPRGELFGLLGPNGAGKTTTIKMLTTLLLPTGGTARVLGSDVVRETNAVRSRIGVVFGGDRGLYDRLSAVDNLRYFAELYGVDPRVQNSRLGELFELVGLRGREHDRVEGFSRGMKQRLHIARGLLHDPEVLFLDEPTIGLDAVAARELRTTVSDVVLSGRTALLTTHYMYEADELCHRIAIINQGRIAQMGTPDELKAQAPEGQVADVLVRRLTGQTWERISALPQVGASTMEERGECHQLTLQAAAGTGMEELQAALLAVLEPAQVLRLERRRATLEDAYVAIVEGSSRQSPVAAGTVE